MYYSLAVRRLLCRLGERMVERGLLETPEDIFYLTMDEQTALSGGSFGDWQDWCAPGERNGCETNSCTSRTPSGDWEAAAQESAPSTGPEREGALRGIPISAGEVTGPVRLVRSTADWDRVKPGDILVVPVIDPGMAPLFGVAAGLIAEMGGTLSHGAIIAREYGLTALVNVPCATTCLRENERVTIISATGTIRRVVP